MNDDGKRAHSHHLRQIRIDQAVQKQRIYNAEVIARYEATPGEADCPDCFHRMLRKVVPLPEGGREVIMSCGFCEKHVHVRRLK